jgi:cyclic nucleotide gated channel
MCDARASCPKLVESFIVAMQLVIWIITPKMAGSTAVATKKMLGFIVFFQYLPRLFQIFTMTSKMLKNPQLLIETTWAVYVYNLLLYLLASHVSPCLFSPISW